MSFFAIMTGNGKPPEGQQQDIKNPQNQQQMMPQQQQMMQPNQQQMMPQQQQMMPYIPPPFPQQPFQQQYAPMQPAAYGAYMPVQSWQPLPIPAIQEHKPNVISACLVELTNDGIKSNDAKLNNKAELTAFFDTYSSRPQALITVWGFHHEHRTSGHGKNRRTHRVTVTDFRYSFELSPYILAGTMDPKFETVFEGYVASGNNLKRCLMEKNWYGTFLMCKAE
jgi:hypothetical protein